MSGLRYAIADCFDDWLKHPHRVEIDRNNLVFDPTQRCDQDTHINMFRGLPLVPVDDESQCTALIEVLLWLCNQDYEVASWLTKWLAYPLQYVGAKMATAVLMHSETQGSGKSLLFDGVIRKIYGEYGCTLGQHQLESQYTDWRSQKLYGLFEEIFSRDQKYSHTGTVKQMISGETQRVEKKFVSGWEEANHMNAVFLSNEIQPFPVEPSDRRMLVIWPEKALPIDLQRRAVAELEAGGATAFLGWLLAQDLTDFEPHTKPPMTEAKERLIDFGRPGWDTFYREWERGALDVPYCSCLVLDLYQEYCRWCRRWGEKPLSLTKLGGFIGTRVRRRRDCHYDQGINRKKGTLFQVGREGDGQSQTQWLGLEVDKFQKAMGQDDE
jgi:putative DNA primase/helicase